MHRYTRGSWPRGRRAVVLAGAGVALAGCGEPLWSSLQDIPGDLADGDDDTVAALACASGQLPFWDGSAWQCGDDADVVAGLTCVSGQVPRFDGAGWSCSDEILATLSCGADQFAQWSGAAWVCGAPVPYTAGVGLAMNGHELSLDGAGCGPDGVLKWNDGSSDWACAADEVGVDGAGTAGYVSQFTDTASVGDSPLYATGGLVGIGTTTPSTELDVLGTVSANGTSLVWNGNHRSDEWAKYFDSYPQYGQFQGLNEVAVDQLVPMAAWGQFRPREYRVHCSPGAWSYLSNRVYVGTLTVLASPGTNYGPGTRGALVFDYTMIGGGYSGTLPAENLTPMLSEVTYSSANAGDDVVLSVGQTDPTLGEVNGMRFKWRASDNMLLIVHSDALDQNGSPRNGRCYVRRTL